MADKFVPTDSKQTVVNGSDAKGMGMIQTDAPDTYTFGCDCGFVSSNWPTKKAAQERAQQHKQEHLTGDLMEDIDEFLARHTKDGK